ncbi:MAG: hypothetical protein JXD23_07085 [Spirochaetales bacterium]|nr:hypothetical protein [Spirochaetales bacterium]
MNKECITVVFVLACSALWGNPDLVASCNQLIGEGKTAECLSLLDSALQTAATPREKATVKWLTSRTVFVAAQKKTQDKTAADDLLREYEKGAALASEAIDLDQTSGEAYFWRASHRASWARIKGGLAALGKVGSVKDDLAAAVRLKPDFANAYYVLGLLYASLPGWPLSFGDKDYAVSLLRKAVDSVRSEADAFGMSLNLAYFLWERNLSRDSRLDRWKGIAGEYAKRNDPADRNCFFEGGIDNSKAPDYADRPMGELADREEALSIVSYLEKRIKESAQGDTEKEKYLEAVEQVKKRMK